MQTEIYTNGRKKRGSAKTPAKIKISAPFVVTDYMTTMEAAAYLKLSRQYLEAARYRGDGFRSALHQAGARGALWPVGARCMDVGTRSFPR